MTESPLSAPSPDSLSDLFLSDPTTLSDGKLTSLILELRRRRSEFQSAEAAKALAPKRVTKVKGKVDAAVSADLDKPATEIDLEDL